MNIACYLEEKNVEIQKITYRLDSEIQFRYPGFLAPKPENANHVNNAAINIVNKKTKRERGLFQLSHHYHQQINIFYRTQTAGF